MEKDTGEFPSYVPLKWRVRNRIRKLIRTFYIHEHCKEELRLQKRFKENWKMAAKEEEKQHNITKALLAQATKKK